MPQTIFHIDVNSAFLSWSALKQLAEDPGGVDLRTIPSAVGGDVEKRRGIITAKSIPAKKYGVQTGEPVMRALQKCPNLVLVRSDFQTYRKYSHAFIDILHQYTDQVQQVSIDEAYLDVTDLESRFGGAPPSFTHTPVSEGLADSVPDEFPLNLAFQIKEQVRNELGFTVNVGISENKLLAKTASDFKKPDRIHTLYPDELPLKFWPLPIGELHGCGHATAERLKSLGIHTVGDAAELDLSVLQSLLGEKGGLYIHRSTNGFGSTHVHPERDEAKGYSNETTTPFDITPENYKKETPPIVRKLSESVARRMQRDNVFASTIGIMVKTDTFQRRSRQVTLPASSNDKEVIYETASGLLAELLCAPGGLFASGLNVRLIGVSATNLDHGEYHQINLFEAMQQIGPVSSAETSSADSKLKQTATSASVHADMKAAGHIRHDSVEKEKKLREMEKTLAKGKNLLETEEALTKEKNLLETEKALTKEKNLREMEKVLTEKFGDKVFRKGI